MVFEPDETINTTVSGAVASVVVHIVTEGKELRDDSQTRLEDVQEAVTGGEME